MTRRVAPARALCSLTALVMAACTSSPGQPSNVTATVTVAQPLQPGNGSQIPFARQPVTLTIQNAVVTEAGGDAYRFEIATDPAFASVVQVKDPVTEGGSGQTSIVLDSLAGGRDYYWRVRATGGGTTGVFTAAFKFTVGAQITISAPVALGPLSGTQTSPRPILRVTNAVRQGPAGALTYRFDIARDAAFTGVIVSGTSGEGAGETDFTPASDLPTGTPLFWRVTVVDSTNNITSPASASQAFAAAPFSQAERIAFQLGQPLWPGIQPPGSVGHATLGDNWDVQIQHHDPTNTFFLCPTIEMLRLFDLLDRGLDPDGAIGWMNGNGYSTFAQWYPPPDKAVIGVQFVYISARNKVVANGIWDIVVKAE